MPEVTRQLHYTFPAFAGKKIRAALVASANDEQEARPSVKIDVYGTATDAADLVELANGIVHAADALASFTGKAIGVKLSPRDNSGPDCHAMPGVLHGNSVGSPRPR